MEITKDILKTMLTNNFKQGKTKMRVVVMINYAPIILYGMKPFYLSIFLENDVLDFGYCSNKNMPELEIRISYDEFIDILEKRTIAKECELSREDTPRELADYYDEREVVKCELILNLFKYKKFALNFITSDYAAFKEDVCRNLPKVCNSSETMDKITRYAIYHQTALDSYLYFHGALTQISKSFCKLHNSVISSFQIDLKTSYIRLICTACGISTTSIADKRVSVTNKRTDEERSISPIVPISTDMDEMERVICTHLSGPDYVGKDIDAYKLQVSYNVVGLIALKDDYSEGGASGFSNYKPFSNEYFDCLAVNTSIYSQCLRSSEFSPYGLRLTEKDGYYVQDKNGKSSMFELMGKSRDRR